MGEEKTKEKGKARGEKGGVKAREKEREWKKEVEGLIFYPIRDENQFGKVKWKGIKLGKGKRKI